MVVVPVGVAAAVLLGLGFTLQQHAAAQAPLTDLLRPRLLLDLIRNPAWLAGIACMIGGQVLGAAALSLADVSRVEPLLATNLLFALAFGRVLYRRGNAPSTPRENGRLGWREWTGAFLLAAGVAAFVVAGQPHGGQRTRSIPAHFPALAAIGGIAALLVVLARRRPLAEKAPFLAGAAGLLYGIQDAFTRPLLADLDHGIAGLLTQWLPYALVVVGLIGLLLAQSAFEAAPLRASLPAINAAEPISGIALGVALYGERLDVSPVNLAAEVAGLVAMVVGVYLVARSPIIARQHGKGAVKPRGPAPATRAPATPK